MPTTRKKVVKTVYKDDEDSDEGGDFSDSGSEAVVSEHFSSEDESDNISENEFVQANPKSKSKPRKKPAPKTNKPKNTNFAKSFISKISKQSNIQTDAADEEIPFSIKDMTDADKLLPSVLNLSESDSSDDDESPKVSHPKLHTPIPSSSKACETDSENENVMEYKDVWSQNQESEEIARKAYLELEKHQNKIEETKMSLQNYVMQTDNTKESDIKDLLALGEDEPMEEPIVKVKKKKAKDDSDDEMEDWEEVKESKGIPQQGLQLVVSLPDAVCRKRKVLDVEMMMKRKMNRVKKEHQIFMHKVHVLCWLGHGNYVSQVLNDQEIMSAVLSLLPSQDCYPGEKVDVKYIEQITTWYKNKITLKQDKHENKFKPKAPPLKDIILQQIKNKVFSTKKYIVFAFVAMLRSLGLQCRVMFNFVTVPIKPPSTELCSLSTKPKDDKEKPKIDKPKEKKVPAKKKKDTQKKIPQLDGTYDSCFSDSDMENIIQLDGNEDRVSAKTRKAKAVESKINKNDNIDSDSKEANVSPPKRPRRQTRSQISTAKNISEVKNNTKTNIGLPTNKINDKISRKSLSLNREKVQNNQPVKEEKVNSENTESQGAKNSTKTLAKSTSRCARRKEAVNPKIVVTDEKSNEVSSSYFENPNKPGRKRSRTTETKTDIKKETTSRARSAQANSNNTSKYFENTDKPIKIVKSPVKKIKTEDISEDSKRVSHRDISKKTVKSNKGVTDDLIHIIKGRVKEAKEDAKKGIVKGKVKKESDEDSDYLPEESPKRRKSESDDDFKATKVTPKAKVSSAKKDRRILSTDDEAPVNKVDVWAEVFIEELEEWISVDVIKGKVHCTNEIYGRSTHPVVYIIGWDNNNKLKDLTKKYVPHWNTVTRKQRVEPLWWEKALQPWIGPKTARDREEDERLERMQLEAPLPKSIAEYKNHPLYALQRHLLKFEAIYPPDAPALGYVRGEAVYARPCVHVCRSRDTWLKEAKVVRLGEQPYKVVKARPKWDKLSNKLITDKPLEVFGPWQVKDYEPPTAENGIVPRNAYGNVELFKQCMLPKGTVHLKLPGLNRVAKKLNIDCAPAMTGFDFNGGWSHPVYDGFVVCEEFGEIITDAWLKDQEEQERKEVEKLEARVYGNWKKLIKGLLIKERLKAKYGFEEPSTSKETKSKGPKLVVKKK